MARYGAGVRTAATAATADTAAAVLWNPHGSISIFLREVWWFKTVATADNVCMARSSARGTQTTTFTPDIDSHFARRYAPISTLVIDSAWSAQPTKDLTYLARANLPAAVGSGFVWVFAEAIEIPAGQGIWIGTPVATILQPSDLTVVWDE